MPRRSAAPARSRPARRPRTRTRDPEAKRARVMRAARELFAERGYTAATTAGVARRAGVSEGIVFHHFGSKEGLLTAVAGEYGRGLAEAMFAGDKHERATFEGRYSRVKGARNVPKPIQQPRIPIMVGGNGPNVTWRLAAKYADELNVDGLSPDEVRDALPIIRARCEEIGRDPATLPVSIHLWWGDIATPGQQRVDLLSAHRELGLSRGMGLIQASAQTDEALESLIEDARAAGLEVG